MVPGTLQRLLFLSPHCDDAVFACGQVLQSHPGSIVATVCAGFPPADIRLTEWDAAAGFTSSAHAAAGRRLEDMEALAALAAIPLWLDFRDAQYRPSHTAGDLQQAITRLIDALRPHAVVIPLGLYHSDHLAVHEAAVLVALTLGGIGWFLYEEALYRRIPGLVAARLRRLREQGFTFVPVDFPVTARSERKMHAIRCYRSQLRALATPGRPGHLDTLAPERYWRLIPPDTG